jgi:hypothetical protein
MEFSLLKQGFFFQYNIYYVNSLSMWLSIERGFVLWGSWKGQESSVETCRSFQPSAKILCGVLLFMGC